MLSENYNKMIYVLALIIGFLTAALLLILIITAGLIIYGMYT